MRRDQLANVFDYRQSSEGVGVSLEYLFSGASSGLIANDLFYGSGNLQGTYTYTDQFRRTTTSDSFLASNGYYGIGVPIANDYFASSFDLPDRFAQSTEFAITSFAADYDYGGYVRLFGFAAPQVNWDSTAVESYFAPSNTSFDDNVVAAFADMTAQVEAVMATTLTGLIENVEWRDGNTAALAVVMQFTPDADTTLTYGDFFAVFTREYYFPIVDISIIGAFSATSFGPEDDVEMILTRFDDSISANEFSAGSLTIDAGSGDDEIFLFYTDMFELPEFVGIDLGKGNDRIEIAPYMNTSISGGSGDDLIYLDRDSGQAEVFTEHTISGGSGDDVIVGAVRGENTISGGNGHDYLYGGDVGNRLSGGTGNDIVYGGRAPTTCRAAMATTRCMATPAMTRCTAGPETTSSVAVPIRSSAARATT